MNKSFIIFSFILIEYDIVKKTDIITRIRFLYILIYMINTHILIHTY